MLRWITYTQSYDLAMNNVRVRETNEEQRGTLVPLWGKTTTHQRFTNADNRTVEFGVRNSTKDGAFLNAGTRVRSAGSQIRRILSRSEMTVPLLELPGVRLQRLQDEASIEAAVTGTINATTGAVIGATLCVLCPPLGAVKVGALALGGISYVSSAVMQYKEILDSRKERNFAAQVNRFIIELNAGNDDAMLFDSFALLTRSATSPQMRALARQLLTVCEAIFEPEDAQSLRRDIERMNRDATPDGRGMRDLTAALGAHYSPAMAVSYAAGR